MFNHQYVLNRFLSRILFIQYVINSYLCLNNSTEDSIVILNEHIENTGFKTDNQNLSFETYDQEFYNRLVNCFDENKNCFELLVKSYTKLMFLDNLSYCMLIAACVEFIIRNNKKHIISDYLKIADMYDISARLVHSVLDDIYTILTSPIFIIFIIFKF